MKCRENPSIHPEEPSFEPPSYPLFTPSKILSSLPPRTPNIVLELLKLVHFLHNLDLLVFPDLCWFILKYEGPGDDCRAPLCTSSDRFQRTRSNFLVST